MYSPTFVFNSCTLTICYSKIRNYRVSHRTVFLAPFDTCFDACLALLVACLMVFWAVLTGLLAIMTTLEPFCEGSTLPIGRALQILHQRTPRVPSTLKSLNVG